MYEMLENVYIEWVWDDTKKLFLILGVIWILWLLYLWVLIFQRHILICCWIKWCLEFASKYYGRRKWVGYIGKYWHELVSVETWWWVHNCLLCCRFCVFKIVSITSFYTIVTWNLILVHFWILNIIEQHA